MITWAEAAPQIAVALAIVAAVGFLLVLVFRQMGKLTKSLTRPGANGQPSSRLETLEGEIKTHGDMLKSHDRMHRRQYAAMSALQKDVKDIYEHVTNGQTSTTPDIPEDIDAADTGRFQVPDEGIAE